MGVVTDGGGWSHLPVWRPVSSRSAAGWSGHSRLCCPSAGSPPGGEMECSSAEHAPSCSEPETMAMAQRHHLPYMCHLGGYIQSARSGTTQSHPLTDIRVLIWGLSSSEWASGSTQIMQINISCKQTETAAQITESSFIEMDLKKDAIITLQHCFVLLIAYEEWLVSRRRRGTKCMQEIYIWYGGLSSKPPPWCCRQCMWFTV